MQPSGCVRPRVTNCGRLTRLSIQFAGPHPPARSRRIRRDLTAVDARVADSAVTDTGRRERNTTTRGVASTARLDPGHSSLAKSSYELAGRPVASIGGDDDYARD